MSDFKSGCLLSVNRNKLSPADDVNETKEQLSGFEIYDEVRYKYCTEVFIIFNKKIDNGVEYFFIKSKENDNNPFWIRATNLVKKECDKDFKESLLFKQRADSLLKSYQDTQKEYKHYQYSYKGIKLDPYRILSVYGITCPAMQHAIKKLLRAGNSVKNLEQDIQEVIDTLKRKLEMQREDEGLVQREDYSETK